MQVWPIEEQQQLIWTLMGHNPLVFKVLEGVSCKKIFVVVGTLICLHNPNKGYFHTFGV